MTSRSPTRQFRAWQSFPERELLPFRPLLQHRRLDGKSPVRGSLNGTPVQAPIQVSTVLMMDAHLLIPCSLPPRQRPRGPQCPPPFFSASLAVRHCAVAISPYVWAIAQRISIGHVLRHIQKWSPITHFDGPGLLNGQRRALQHQRSPCNVSRPRMGSLRDGAVDDFIPGGHETPVTPSCHWPTYLDKRVSFVILLAMLCRFCEGDGAMVKNMAKWRTDRDALRHPPSQNGEMAHR